MPGKKDPEYFPLNLNMSGIGSFYGDDDLSPLTGSPPHHGKFEYGSGSPPLNMSFNVSIPPANSEEDDTDDESSSVAGSDIDVDMDTLVYSIREKLKMSPKFSANPSDSYWADESPSNEPNGCAVVKPSGVVANSGSVVSGSNNSNNNSVHSNNNNISNSSRRFRNHHHPYSQWRHSIHHSNNHHHHSNHSSNYHHRQIINGGIQKQHHKSSCHQWWTSKSFNDISRMNSKKGSADGGPTDPYSLLQELIESGSLIKEAVRRISLKQKRFTSLNANANNSSLTKKFSYRDEDTENSYPSMPMSAP